MPNTELCYKLSRKCIQLNLYSLFYSQNLERTSANPKNLSDQKDYDCNILPDIVSIRHRMFSKMYKRQRDADRGIKTKHFYLLVCPPNAFSDQSRARPMLVARTHAGRPPGPTARAVTRCLQGPALHRLELAATARN